jgi:hypothetical protein
VGVAASAPYPTGGRIDIDRTETWSQALLLEVVCHELGHALGLPHSNNNASIMFPTTTGRTVIDPESTDTIRSMYRWQAQRPLTDRGSTDGPSLGLVGTAGFTSGSYDLCSVWTGVVGDSKLYTSTLGLDGWSPQRVIPNVGSSHRPGLCSISVPAPDGSFRTGLFMAWKGARNDANLYWSRSSDGMGWEPQTRVDFAGTTCGPAVANFDGTIVMAWKGIDGDAKLYWSELEAGGFRTQHLVNDVGTTDTPALVFYLNRLWMFWKGIDGDANVYYSSRTKGTDWSPQQRVACVFTVNLGKSGVEVGYLPIGTTAGVAATLRGTRVLLAWKGVTGDSKIYFSYFDGTEFTGQVAIPDRGTSTTPGLCTLDGTTYMLWKGVGGDTGLYMSQL